MRSTRPSGRVARPLRQKSPWCRKEQLAGAARCSWISNTTKPIYPATRCHLNAMVADTSKWEQSAAFLLDSHAGVKSWVKNDRLGFFIPYRDRGLPARYVPDFLVVMHSGQNLIVEIKGQVTDTADSKAKAAQRWVAAVNQLGQHGTWHYLLVTDPARLGEMLSAFNEVGRAEQCVKVGSG